MSPESAAAIFAAGLAAGTINTIVGSGSLITFPTLLAVGYSPVVANVTNTLGLVPGVISGSFGYRRELSGQADRVRSLGLVGTLGGLTGGILLLVLPGSYFRAIVPVLIVAACLLVAFQPRLSRRLAERRPEHTAHHSAALMVSVYATGVYGGYFGAAQGVILFSLLAIFIPDNLQRLNGLKNIIVMFVNGVAAILFIIDGRVVWTAAAILAAGAILGGQIGAGVGRRLPAVVLRGVIIVVGTVVAVTLIV